MSYQQKPEFAYFPPCATLSIIPFCNFVSGLRRPFYDDIVGATSFFIIEKKSRQLNGFLLLCIKFGNSTD